MKIGKQKKLCGMAIIVALMIAVNFLKADTATAVAVSEKVDKDSAKTPFLKAIRLDKVLAKAYSFAGDVFFMLRYYD